MRSPLNRIRNRRKERSLALCMKKLRRNKSVPGPVVTHVAALAIIAVFLAGCARTPEGREADHLQKGKNYVAKKDYRKAVIEFKIASQNMPKDAEPFYQLGMT